jgi:hypothetical protein
VPGGVALLGEHDLDGVVAVSPVEEWHAGDGPLDDGDMLCINAHTPWRVRIGRLRRHGREPGCAVRRVAQPLMAGWPALVRAFLQVINPATRMGIRRCRSPTVLVLNESSGVSTGALNRMPLSGVVNAADGDASAVGKGPSRRAVVGMLPAWQTREPSGPWIFTPTVHVAAIRGRAGGAPF